MAAGREGGASGTMEAATAARLQAWSLHEQAKQLVGRAARALGSDVRVMPLKGVLLAALGVVHPAERPIRDVDLLVDRLSERTLVARLAAAGFRIAEVARAPGYVALSHPAHGDLWLDLHTRVAPIGLGRVPRSYLFEDGTPDEARFGVPVVLPTRTRLVVQLVANVLKDRVVLASQASATDLATLLAACAPEELDAVASELSRVSLSRGGRLALMWVQRRAGSAGVEAMLQRLDPRGAGRDALEAELDALEAGAVHGLWARIRARARADSAGLWVLATLGAGAALVTHPLRARSLGRCVPPE